MTPVRLEPAAPQSRVKLSATALPQSFFNTMFGYIGMDHVISELCYKGKFYKGMIGKWQFMVIFQYSETCVIGPLKNRQNKDLNDKWELN